MTCRWIHCWHREHSMELFPQLEPHDPQGYLLGCCGWWRNSIVSVIQRAIIQSVQSMEWDPFYMFQGIFGASMCEKWGFQVWRNSAILFYWNNYCHLWKERSDFMKWLPCVMHFPNIFRSYLRVVTSRRKHHSMMGFQVRNIFNYIVNIFNCYLDAAN